MQSTARAGQSLSHFVTAPFAQGSLSSCHPEHGTKWSGGIPSQVTERGGIPRFADFAPMGLVRRFVEMLLQAGISPRVGRNDSQEQKRAPPLSISPQGKLHLSTAVLASRRSAFCGHSAQPNAAPFTPAAPFSPKSFPMKIFWREVIMT